MRCDYGTENTRLATVQVAFRLFHDDSLAGERSFLYGPSTGNIVSMHTRAIPLDVYYMLCDVIA